MESAITDLSQTARLFQALSDETRLRIVQTIADGECCVCELEERVDAYQSRLSFHLKKLKDAGVVFDRKEGRWVYYSLNPEVLEELRGLLGTLEASARSSGSQRCC